MEHVTIPGFQHLMSDSSLNVLQLVAILEALLRGDTGPAAAGESSGGAAGGTSAAARWRHRSPVEPQPDSWGLVSVLLPHGPGGEVREGIVPGVRLTQATPASRSE
eukprot:356120-Chlamydomonas_euryale.AAC.21